MLRLFANIFIFASLLFFPWWVTFFVAFAAVIFFRAFYEMVVWALIGDLLYGTKTELFFNVPLVFTVGALFLIFIAEYVKKMTRFY